MGTGEVATETTEAIVIILQPWMPLREMNPSRRTKIVLGMGLAAAVGVTVYFGTRRRAAASAAAKAFDVTPGCEQIRILDDAGARASVTAAVMAVRPSPDDSALTAAQQVLAVLFPECDWSNVPQEREFMHQGSVYTWSDVEPLLVGKTVGELVSVLTVLREPISRSVATPLPPFFSWLMNQSATVPRRL